MKHDEWFELSDERDKVQGRVRLMLQWIYSQQKYLEQHLEQWKLALH
jgi:hypothetical protein